MRIMGKIARGIDIVNDKLGNWLCWIVPLLMAITMYEVIVRYGFNNPTIWSLEISQDFMAIVVVVGAGYTLLYNGHVSMDVVTMRLKPKPKAILEMVFALPCIFFYIGILLYWLLPVTSKSVQMQEKWGSSVLASPIYPIYVLLCAGLILLLLQAVAQYIRNVQTLRK